MYYYQPFFIEPVKEDEKQREATTERESSWTILASAEMLTNDNIRSILSERGGAIEITLVSPVNEISPDQYRELYELLYPVTPVRFQVRFLHEGDAHTAEVQRQANRYFIYPDDAEKSQFLKGFVIEKDYKNVLRWGDSFGEIKYLFDISRAILAQESQ